MTISPTNIISPWVTPTNTTTYQKQRNAQFQRFDADVSAGDLQSAKQDYSSLRDLIRSHDALHPNQVKHPEAARDFRAIGSALEGGSLAATQPAITTFKQLIAPHGFTSGKIFKVDPPADSDAPLYG